MKRYQQGVRGTHYRLIGTAGVQASTGPLCQGDQAEVYRGEADGKLLVRKDAEFHDGRFEVAPEDDDARAEATTQAIVAACEGQSFGDTIDAIDLALHRLFNGSLSHLINREQLLLLREIHTKVVGQSPASDDLIDAARAVVAARNSKAGWDTLSNAIGRLEELVGSEKPR